MNDKAEESIARLQAAGQQGETLPQRQARSLAYLNERILTYLLVIAVIGLMLLWATAKSPLLLYGSLAAVVLLTLLWGYARIQRIERLRAERERTARNWHSGAGD